MGGFERDTAAISHGTGAYSCDVRPGWCAARDATLDEDATLWSQGGELLAQSRQLALAL